MLPRLFRTERFWLPAIFGIVFALFIGLLGMVALSSTEKAFQNFIYHRSENTIARLRTLYTVGDENGPGSLDRATRFLVGHQASTGSTTHNLLQVQGKWIVGNLPTMTPLIGPQVIRNPAKLQLEVVGIGAELGPGVYVFVGTEMTYFDQLRKHMLYVLLWLLGGILVVAPVGGYFISRRFLNRIDAISQTCQAIMNGNLNDRVPVRTSKDELDRLSEVVNAMLTRISNLVISLRQVSSDVAHDLRTPMVRLRLSIEKALASAKTPEELRTGLQSTIVASDEILQMFDAVLRLSEIEGGLRSKSLRGLDLAALTEKVIEFYRPVVEDGGRRLQVAQLQACDVNGNGALLSQLLSNLLENSITHTPAGTTITIALQAAQGEARIMVRDNGGGIPQHERTKVLQRFYRRDVSRTSPGNGLGLSLVAAIADAHSGQVIIRDPSDDTAGVEFVIVMPLKVADTQKTEARFPAADR